MRYCSYCGNQLDNQDTFCSKCGEAVNSKPYAYMPHLTPRPNTDPEVMFPTTEAKVWATVTGALFGAVLIGGGIYSVVKFTPYTPWAIAGGCGKILAGVGCLVRSAHLIRLIKRAHAK